MSYADKIIVAAKSYVGQQEIQPNKGFQDPSFETKMRARGWEAPQPWCGYFAKQCWVDAYADNVDFLATVKKLSNGGALTTLADWKASEPQQVGHIPVPGALVIFEEGNGPNGHVGVVISVQGNIYATIEGNTNTDGSRDGYEVAQKTHDITRPFNPNGLNLVAFIHPLEFNN